MRVFTLQRPSFPLNPAAFRTCPSLQLTVNTSTARCSHWTKLQFLDWAMSPDDPILWRMLPPLPGKTSTTTVAPFTWLLAVFPIRSDQAAPLLGYLLWKDPVIFPSTVLQHWSQWDDLSLVIWTDSCIFYLYSWQTMYFEKIKDRTLRATEHTKSIR